MAVRAAPGARKTGSAAAGIATGCLSVRHLPVMRSPVGWQSTHPPAHIARAGGHGCLPAGWQSCPSLPPRSRTHKGAPNPPVAPRPTPHSGACGSRRTLRSSHLRGNNCATPARGAAACRRRRCGTLRPSSASHAAAQPPSRPAARAVPPKRRAAAAVFGIPLRRAPSRPVQGARKCAAALASGIPLRSASPSPHGAPAAPALATSLHRPPLPPRIRDVPFSSRLP